MKNGEREKLIILTDVIHEEPVATKIVEINPATTAGEVLRLAIERGAETDQLERLLKLELKWRAYQAELAYQQDFLAFKGEPELKILKDEIVEYEAKGKLVSYSFSPLDRVESVLIPLLARHNFTHHWRTETAANGYTKVTCVLKHLLCHENDGASLLGPPDTTGSKNGHQAIGSNVSYLERYTLCAAVGITPRGVDKDARAADQPVPATINGNGGNDQDLTPILRESEKQALEAKIRACADVADLRQLFKDMNDRQREAMLPGFKARKAELETVCK